MDLIPIIFAVFLLIYIALTFNSYHKIKKNKLTKPSKNRLVVYVSETYALLGIIGAIVFALFILLFPILWPDEPDNSYMLGYICFGSFFLLNLYIIQKSLRFRIVVEKQNITVYPLLFKPYNFSFDDIKTITRQTKKRYEGHAERIIVRTQQGKKVIVDSSFICYKKLVERLLENVDQSKLQGTWEKKEQ